MNWGHTSDFEGAFAAGRVSTGLIHATPGEMKSLRSSAERMADMLLLGGDAPRRFLQRLCFSFSFELFSLNEARGIW